MRVIFKRNTFTLVEILVSLVVLSVIMISGGRMLVSTNRVGRDLVITLEVNDNAKLALDFIVNDVKYFFPESGGAGVDGDGIGVATLGPLNRLKFYFSKDTDGDLVADVRIWYWRGTGNMGWDAGDDDVLYRGVDDTIHNSLAQSFMRAARDNRYNREHLAEFVLDNPDDGGGAEYEIFEYDAATNVLTITLTVNRDAGNTAGNPVDEDNNHTVRTQVFIRNAL